MKKGGARVGAGRKPKAEEQELIEALKPMHPQAIKAMEAGLKEGDYRYVKLFLQYFYGNPKQMTDLSSENNTKNIINLGSGSIPFEHWINRKE
jgi:hypothetical protein